MVTRAQKIKQRYGLDQSLFSEAEASGVDPRTVEFLTKKSEKILKKASAKGVRGMAARGFEQQNKVQEDIKEQLTSEARRLPEIQAIRERRKKAVAETIQAMSRKRGKVSLLSGLSGGSGFFTGYSQ